MKVLFATAEVSPYSKVGGLADVAGALPKELARSGIKMQVITPLYSLVNMKKWGIRFSDLTGSVSLGQKTYRYKIASVSNVSDYPVEHLFVFNKQFFSRSGIYTARDGEGFDDNNARFFFFQKVVIDLIKSGIVDPDMVHINDFHSALIPFLLKNRGISIPSLLTVHNFLYQGQFLKKELMLFTKEEVKFLKQHDTKKRWNSFNALEIGLTHADLINTVSVNYARELLTEKELSFGLNEVLMSNQSKFQGILNGVDYTIWNPEIDPFLQNHFGPGNLDGKRINKTKLKEKCGLPGLSDIPLIGSVSRLVESKGFDLILDILKKIIRMDVQLIFLGTGDKKIKESLQSAAETFPHRISFWDSFDEDFAHLIEAGSDMFLMPSRFEPCGLNQIYSLKYGTIPIVHETGGLADTVRNWDGRKGNGFVFKKYSRTSLLKTVHKAVKTYHKKSLWIEIIKNAMQEDFSWYQSAQNYKHLYHQLLEGKD